jgi:hypothetical protein
MLYRSVATPSVSFSCAAVMLVSIVLLSRSPAQEGDAMANVKASDLLRKVQVLGNLGTPFGKIVTVRGEWHDPGRRKSGDLRFVITAIDGHPTKGVEFTEP